MKDREAWFAAVNGITKSWTQLGNWTAAILISRNLNCLKNHLSTLNIWFWNAILHMISAQDPGTQFFSNFGESMVEQSCVLQKHRGAPGGSEPTHSEGSRVGWQLWKEHQFPYDGWTLCLRLSCGGDTPQTWNFISQSLDHIIMDSSSFGFSFVLWANL